MGSKINFGMVTARETELILLKSQVPVLVRKISKIRFSYGTKKVASICN